MQIKHLIYTFLTLLFALAVVGNASAQLDASALMRGQRNASRGNTLGGMQQQNGLGGYGTNPYDTGEGTEEGQNGEQAVVQRRRRNLVNRLSPTSSVTLSARFVTSSGILSATPTTSRFNR